MYRSEIERIQKFYEISGTVFIECQAQRDWPITYVSSNIDQYGFHAPSLVEHHMSFSQMIFPDDLPHVRHCVKSHSEQKDDCFLMEFRILLENSEVRWIGSRVILERDENGDLRSYQIAVSDITREKKREETLHQFKGVQESFQQSKLIQMGEMINMIAHQWRQPINTISATAINLELLADMKQLSKSELGESTHFIQQQCQAMSETIDTFINFVKPVKSKQDFLLSHAIRAVLQIIGAQLKNHAIELSIELDEDVTLNGQEDLLQQVLLNLLSNAKDAFDMSRNPNKQITLSLLSDPEGVILGVADNAGGIEKQNRDKIFNPYFTTKEQGKGSGLGLYICKGIIEKSFLGSITYHPLEAGSRFELRFYI